MYCSVLTFAAAYSNLKSILFGLSIVWCRHCHGSHFVSTDANSTAFYLPPATTVKMSIVFMFASSIRRTVLRHVQWHFVCAFLHEWNKIVGFHSVRRNDCVQTRPSACIQRLLRFGPITVCMHWCVSCLRAHSSALPSDCTLTIAEWAVWAKPTPKRLFRMNRCH